MKRAIANLIDAAMNAYAPIVHNRSAAAFTDDIGGADLLADLEADTEVWEPTRATPNPPAGAGATMPPLPAVASATSAGGFPKVDPLATVIAVVLRGQGLNSSAIYADLVARELRHHFTFQPK